jgi:tripartite-type tricarboxylate transporter receptor subunit TctC
MKRLLSVAAALAAVSFSTAAFAQNFPERPVTSDQSIRRRGPADLLARTIAASVTEALGQPVIVENKPGAGTAIGARFVAQAKPDGYTLFIGGSPSHIVTPALVKDANYDGIKDFATVALVASVPNVLVVPASRPWKNVKELVEAAKAAGGSMTFASVGVGSLPQFLGLLLQQQADVKLTHVPYGGAAPAVVDLLAGNVDMAFLNIAPVLAHVRGEKLRALADCQQQSFRPAFRRSDHGRRRLQADRDEYLVRDFRTGGDSPAGNRQAPRRDRESAEVREREGEVGRSRRGNHTDVA